MAALGQLVVSLTANIAQFQQSLDRAAYVSEKNFNKIQDTAKTAAAAITGYLALGQLTSAIKTQIDYADQLFKTSQKIGIATEQLSVYAYAADLAGVNVEQLQQSLIKLSKATTETAAGTGEAREAFSAMGISVKDSNGILKDNAVLIEELADKFAGYADGAEKTALAVRIFGKSGAEMIPFLNGGSEAIQKAREEAERFNIVIGGDFARRAEEVNDNFTRLKKAGEGFSLMVSESLLPRLQNITSAMIEAAKESGILKSLLVGFGGVISEAFTEYDFEKIKRLKKEIADLNDKIANPAFGFIPRSRLEIANLQEQAKSRQALLDQILAENEARKKQVAIEAQAAQRPTAPRMVDENARKKAIEEESRARTLLGQQIQEGMDEEMRTMAELAQVVTDYRQKIRKAEEDAEKARMKAWMEFIDAQIDAEERAMRAAAGFDEETGEPIKKSLTEMQKAAIEFGDRISSSFEQAILRGAGLRDIMQGLLQDIIKIAARKLITEPLGNAISSAIGGIFKGGKALGGFVGGGNSYLVGEKGPELFTPAVNGAITPNNELGAGVIVNQNINISTGVAQTVRAEVIGMMPRIMEATKAAVVDSKRRGGSFGKAFA